MEDILREYGGLLAEVDRWFGRCQDAAAARIRCMAGCSGCCRGLFDITLLDAAVLVQGFSRLGEGLRQQVLLRCHARLAEVQLIWPEFDAPYLLNHRPEDEWKILMPEGDETPCPLLGDDGRCLVYEHRPMTCRLHGLPHVDLAGEVLHDEWCTLNFIGADPLSLVELRGDFIRLFEDEVRLFRRYSTRLLGHEVWELDTFIPTALLIDFDRFDWRRIAAIF
ncbi:MAG: YkgJ family cysteine cluster protein [Desulfuromonadales bacterium]|nr:MAG: YkgJ family cysteine cluster protein [Desulfuromonadales bacterium]